MEQLILNRAQTYGINCIYKDEELMIKDSMYSGTYILPFGETLFSIIENIDFINDVIVKKGTVGDRYLLKEKLNFINDIKTDLKEINRLLRIKDYLKLCCDNANYCSVESLYHLAVGLFDDSNDIISLFHSVGVLRLRKYKSETKLPFSITTTGMINRLKADYSEFSFSTETKFNSLSELCIISLYEIFSLELLIKRCNVCMNFFVGSNFDKYCNRELLENDFKGCKAYKVSLTNNNYKNDNLVREYKRVYARLLRRTKSNSIQAIEIFEDFKNGWSKINQDLKNKANKRFALETYLSSERWK